MKRFSFLLLLLALTLCACRAQESPAPLPDAPAASPSDQTPIPLTPDPTPDAPAEPTVDTPEDGVHLQDGTAYYYQNGAPVTGSGLTELDGAWYVFQPDGSLFPFVHGLNDCNGILYYHTGEDGFALNTPEAGLYDDGEALYFVQDDRSLLQNGSEGYLTFGADGRYTSGSAELDEGIWQLLQDSTPDTGADSAARLEAVFDYIRDNFKYLSMAHYDVGTTDWAQEAAEAFLQQRKGNCYCFAATFMYCARRLGYQAYVVAGHESRPDNDHAWTMIDEADGTYLHDVQLEYAYLYQFGKGEIDAFRMPDDGGSVYRGFRYYFPE